MKQSFWLISRIFIGLVFATAGFSKLMEPVENFRGAIAQYEILPYAFVPIAAHILPWLELIFGTFLMLGFATRLSALAVAGLALTFMIALGASNALFDGAKDCGCFGAGGPIHLSVRQVFFLDFFSLGFCLNLFLYKKKHPLALDDFLSR